MLTITARPESLSNGLQYVSGLIDTYKSFSQLYGYFEVRAQLPAGQGLWPAFWLLPADDVNTSELDAFEVLGNDPSSLYATVHGTTGGQSASLSEKLAVADTSAGFHTYGVDWEPDTVTFYMDGVEIASEPTPASMDKPMYVLLNLAVGGAGSWPGAPDGTTPAAAQFNIDYVRAYATANTVDVEGTQAVASEVTPPAPVTVGTGPDTLTIELSEDAFQGDAQFTLEVDGQAIGGTLTTTAQHDAGQEQAFNLQGSFGTGPHVVSVTFLNPTQGGTPALQRNLYVEGFDDGGTVTTSDVIIKDSSTKAFASIVTPITIGSGPDSIVLDLSEDAYLGDALFTVAVDGQLIGGPEAAMALNGSGQEQAVTVDGSFGAGQHTITVSFLNDTYNPDGPGDRNLYVDAVLAPGIGAQDSGQLYSDGSLSFTFNEPQAPAPVAPPVAQQTPTPPAPPAATPAVPSDPLFDAAYYLQANPDVAAAGVDPLTHFDDFGWHEGRNPDALFDTTFYLQQNPDVAAAGVNPLTHFEDYGWHEGRDPNPLFDTTFYLTANPDVAAAGMDPMLHFEQYGWHEGRNPDALFNTQYYLSANPDVAAANVDPLVHFETFGWHEGRNPDALFDVKYYLANNPDVAAAHIDPLVHYDTYGWREGRNPSAAFDTNAYLNAHPDVKAAGVDPLAQYLAAGQAQGYAIYSV